MYENEGGLDAAESFNLLLSVTVVSGLYPYSSMIDLDRVKAGVYIVKLQ